MAVRASMHALHLLLKVAALIFHCGFVEASFSNTKPHMQQTRLLLTCTNGVIVVFRFAACTQSLRFNVENC